MHGKSDTLSEVVFLKDKDIFPYGVNHLVSSYAKCSEKLAFLTYQGVRDVSYSENYLSIYLKLCFGFAKYSFSTPADIYLLKVKNRNTRTRCEICSKLTIKTP